MSQWGCVGSKNNLQRQKQGPWSLAEREAERKGLREEEGEERCVVVRQGEGEWASKNKNKNKNPEDSVCVRKGSGSTPTIQCKSASHCPLFISRE